ncbi:hypothetical protein KJ855_01900 [Patescibacteria group bacterium]|nr:hypothetical protein [Patescibacteria group bacterium]
MEIKYNYFNIVLFYLTISILFIAVASIVILYSIGYRYNFAYNQIVKTGIIRLSPIVNGYEILIDDKKIESNLIKKTTQIPNLIPNTYQLSINYPNHYSWNKKITVDPNSIHNENNILLIPQKPTTTDIAYIQQYTNNPFSSGMSAYINIEQLHTIDIGHLNIVKYPQVQIHPTSQIKWLDSQLIAIITSSLDSTVIQTINIYNHNITHFNLPFPSQPQDIIGHAPLTPSTLLVTNNHNLYKVETSNFNQTPVIKNIKLATMANNNIYFLTNQELTSSIYYLNLLNNQTNEIATNNNIKSFQITNNKYLITNHDNSLAQIFDISNPKEKSFTINSNIQKASLSPDQNHILLLSQSNEIIVINSSLADTTANVLLRLQEEITNSQWFDNSNIIYSAPHNTYRIDIDGDNNQEITFPHDGEVNLVQTDQQKILATEYYEDQYLLKAIFIKENN